MNQIEMFDIIVWTEAMDVQIRRIQDFMLLFTLNSLRHVCPSGLQLRKVDEKLRAQSLVGASANLLIMPTPPIMTQHRSEAFPFNEKASLQASFKTEVT
jgi:hypothetical protein